MANLEAAGIHGIVISSVVPPLDPVLRQVCERYFNSKPLLIEPGVKTGMPVQYAQSAEVGADRIVNAVAAFEKYGGPCVIVDFGTATTFIAFPQKASTSAERFVPASASPPTRSSSAPLGFRASRLQARPGHRHQHGRQLAMRSLLRIPRPGRWHPRTSARRTRCRNKSDCHRRPWSHDRHRIEAHQAVDDFSDAASLRIIWERNSATRPVHAPKSAQKASKNSHR